MAQVHKAVHRLGQQLLEGIRRLAVELWGAEAARRAPPPSAARVEQHDLRSVQASKDACQKAIMMVAIIVK